MYLFSFIQSLFCYRTWDNAELSDSMIRQLEAQGLQMANEKQVYFGNEPKNTSSYLKAKLNISKCTITIRYSQIILEK